MPPVTADYNVAHVVMRKIPLASWCALGVGTSGKQHRGVLITPYFKETRSATPQVFPNEQHPFAWQFNFKGKKNVVTAISDREAPGIDVIYLKNELYQRDMGNMTISEGDRVAQIENFVRPALEVISHIPHVDAVNCHGVETSLLALLMRQDPRYSQIKVISTLHNIDDERIRDFSPDHFEGKPGFDLLLSQNWLSYFGGKVSMLGTAIFFSHIAMAISKDTLTQLVKSGFRSAEFFKDMVRRGKLSYLLEPGQESLETRAKGKLVVDFSSKALRMIDRYGAAIEYSREGMKDFKRAFLVDINAEALSVPVASYEADLKSKITSRLGEAIAERIHVFPKKKEGSGSSIVHMLEEAAKYVEKHPGEEPPVIYLDVDGENVTLFDMSLTEFALRQVSYLLPQLRKDKVKKKDEEEKEDKEKEKWFFVKGNTTISLPAERQRIGNALAKYPKANILIFGRPVVPEKLQKADPNKAPRSWGVIFTNKNDGRVTRIMEKPSYEEVKARLDSFGDEGLYFNLSNYAFSEEAASAVLKEYSGKFRNAIGFADTYKLHIVKHILAPMVMAPDERVEWGKKWEAEGFDAEGHRIESEDWLELFEAAQRIKKACGNVALVGGGGTFIDIRQGELRRRLEKMVAKERDSAEGQVIREIFNLTIPEEEERPIVEEEESLPEVTPMPEPEPISPEDLLPWEKPPK